MRRHRASVRCGGTILIVTLWVIFAIAGLVLSFAHEMRGELLASANQVAAIQAAAVERGAEQYAVALVAEQGSSLSALTEASFRAIQLEGGLFWILRPDYGDEQIPSFGLVDESSKLNLNTASSSSLLGLPGMTSDLAAAIVDWRDADSDVSPDGAEDESYLSLPQPYRCKNGPFETVEEVLLVRGATNELIYGMDPGFTSSGAFSREMGARTSALTDPQLARGIFDYLTIYSSEPNTSSDGQQRIDLNADDPSRLGQLLTDTFGAARAADIRFRAAPRPPFRSIFDFNTRASLSQEEFEKISDRITTNRGQTLKGLINVNTAPRDVLLTLPGLDESDVTSLIAHRSSTGGQETGIAWVAEALGPKAAGMGGSITGRSYQYSADIVAASVNGRAFKRYRVVIDATKTPPQVIYRADLTSRGWPLDPAILASLRAATALPASATSGRIGVR